MEPALVLRPALSILLLGLGLLRAQAPASPGLEFGFQERVRSEAWDNLGDHRDAAPDFRSQLRYRTRVWAVVPLGDSLSFTAGLVNENRKIRRPDVAAHGREVVFESLFLDWRLGSAWSLRAGRQNLMRGDGFILWDGSALDGSRTAYLNAVDLVWTGGATKVEFLAISNPLRERYLPRLNEAETARERQLLNERDEAALGVYGTWNRPGFNLQTYFFHKTERHDVRAAQDPLFAPDRRVDTLGARLEAVLGPGWLATGEVAAQGGRQAGRPGTPETAAAIRAWAGQGRLTRTFAGALNPELSVAWVALSGDDPHTQTREGWDPLFSRWPKWSEAYIYSLVPEGGVATWSNLRLWEATLQSRPLKALALRASVLWLRAQQAAPVGGVLFAQGLGRGRLLELRADLTLSERWQGHVLYERLDPGTFYSGPDAGRFFRLELVYTLRQRR